MSLEFPFEYADIEGLGRLFYPIIKANLKTINGWQEFEFLVDTGADITTVPSHLLHQHDEKHINKCSIAEHNIYHCRADDKEIPQMRLFFGFPAWLVLVIFLIGLLVILSLVLKLLIMLLPVLVLAVVIFYLFRYLNKLK